MSWISRAVALAARNALASSEQALDALAPTEPAEPNAEPPRALTQEQATAYTIRALKECFPDRWEEIWAALGKSSGADKVAQALAANPQVGVGALVGGLLGAAIASSAGRPR